MEKRQVFRQQGDVLIARNVAAGRIGLACGG